MKPKKVQNKTRKSFLNKKAGFLYDLTEGIEAGIVLTGPEIKAIRAGKINLTGSHVRIINGELFLLGSNFQVLTGDPLRSRKLLAHHKEIERLFGETVAKGKAIIPKKIYFKKGRAKVLIALGKGKKLWDKRETLKRKDLVREQLRGDNSELFKSSIQP